MKLSGDVMEDNLEQFHTESIPDKVETEKRPGFLRFVIDVLETLILSVILFAAINTVSARIRVDGSSMEPTLHSGEFVIVNKLSYKFSEPMIGDVIVFHFPRDPEQEYIKRVIGLPGERVEIRDGDVYVNDRPIEEDYIAADPAYDIISEVPEDSLFVLGDNRNNSSDSHNWGPVPLDFVVGKAVFVYWPPTEWGFIDHPPVAIAAP
jgi:signal peptidase I